MTIESSLRRRAQKSRRLAALWLCVAVIILVASYAALPTVTYEMFRSLTKLKPSAPAGGEKDPTSPELLHLPVQTLALVTALLGLASVAFGSFLLSRYAFVELELATRCSALADALCLAGDDFDRLRQTASVLVPKAKYLSAPDFSLEDLKTVATVLKETR